MSTPFSGYPDALAVATGSMSMEETSSGNFERIIRKLKRKIKKMKRALKEQRAAEAVRIAEEKRAAEEAAQKNKDDEEKLFFSKVKDAVVKGIPAMLTAVVTFFLKRFFSGKKETKSSQEE